MNKIYNKTNFHKHTFCIFKEVDFERIQSLKSNYISKSGSSYYFTKLGVYRVSNHWGRAANCKWRLEINSKFQTPNSNRTKVGYANWSDFFPDNDFEKLYFIEVDYANQSAHFNHKCSANFTNDKVLRTATETTKTLKQIRILFEETAWAKYLKEENIEKLRKAIIEELITTSKTFQEVRKSYLKTATENCD